MKKGEAADTAEKLLDGKNWLPEFMAAPKVREARFYDNDDDSNEDGEDETILASGQTGESSDAGAVMHDAAEQPVSVGVAPWPFPKAADFAAAQADADADDERAEAIELAQDEEVSDCATASVWPLPPTNPRALPGVRHAA